jgi:hypothetical protein
MISADTLHRFKIARRRNRPSWDRAFSEPVVRLLGYPKPEELPDVTSDDRLDAYLSVLGGGGRDA